MSQENPRSNKTIVAEINQVSNPEAGAKLAPGKVDNETDALGKPSSYKVESVKDAEVKTGVATKCMHKQAGNHMDNMTQPHSGVNDPGHNES